jgi:hypothetical protein
VGKGPFAPKTFCGLIRRFARNPWDFGRATSNLESVERLGFPQADC